MNCKPDPALSGETINPEKFGKSQGGLGVPLYLFAFDPAAQAHRVCNKEVIRPLADKPHALRGYAVLKPGSYTFSLAHTS